MSSRLTALCLALAAAPASAQLPAIFPAGGPVQDLWYPKLFWTSRNGVTVGGYYGVVLKHGYETFDSPPAFRAAAVLNGQISASGSRQISLDGFAPALFDGWRLRVTFTAQRRNRADYFGIGNESVFDDANQRQDGLFYRARHLRYVARGEVQRRLVGGLRALVGVHAERWRLDPLTPTSQLGQDAAANADPTIGRSVGDLSGRLGLVFDTRDDESAPNRGVFLEAIHAWGRADAQSYTRTTVSARGYLPLSTRFAVAARVLAQGMGGTPRLGSLFVIERSDAPTTGLGGPDSHRALFRDRLLGRDKLLSNLDLFYTVFEIPTLVRFRVIGFLDAGRVFNGPAEDFRITTDDITVGGGGGLALHLFRNAILGLTIGGGPDGAVFHALTRWAY